jgi:uncharacterized protein (DUF58 family)
MRVTKFLIYLSLLGVITSLLGIRFPVMLPLTFGYDILLAGAMIADFFLTSKPSQTLVCERHLAEQLSLGTHNRISITASLRGGINEFVASGARYRFLIRDDPPQDFTIEGDIERAVVLTAAHREENIEYTVTPHRQGDYRFGDIYALVTGPLRLISRFERLDTASDVKVYPNLQETEKYDLLARKGLLMQVGIRSLRIRGTGSEFESLRDYVIGDEYRKIDWPATARRNKLISRQYNVEKAQNIVLVIDCGRNMLQPVQKMTKLDFIINTALMLGYVAASQDDKVGLVIFDAEMRTFIPPAKGKAQIFRLLSALYNVTAQMVESDYRAGFLEVAARWRRRSLVVFFTDLVDPESSAEILNAIAMVEKRHKVLCVTVSDPTILAAASSVPTTEAEVYRKSVALQVLQERKSAISLLKRRNVWTIDSPPENLSADLINHYLELKARSGI